MAQGLQHHKIVAMYYLLPVVVAKDLFEGYDMVRTRPDVEVEERPIDKRAMRQERGMHDYNILKKFPWE